MVIYRTLFFRASFTIVSSNVNFKLTLNLQANFISELPDIELLVNTLVYLNLSFNEFRVSISLPKLSHLVFSSQMENEKRVKAFSSTFQRNQLSWIGWFLK